MDIKFKYLEKVVVKTSDSEYHEIKDKQGTVIGLPDAEDRNKNYIIYFTLTDENCWTVPAKHLQSTELFEPEENIYSSE